ncbi:MAG TPA: type II toxin-antitoxin system VapC family toxin [Polyangiaceae bacterium]|nr:type II toxin-antitoxin system VapC family toxin [Polyangiaceae bacterium]
MSLKFMLDTDSVSFALRGYGRVGARLVEHAPSHVCISAVTAAELRFGAERRDSRKLRRLIETFTSTVSVMPFDDECAAAFGKVAARLMEKGRRIGHYDALIAAHAIALEVTLVTNNEKHFGQVEGLKLANWV